MRTNRKENHTSRKGVILLAGALTICAVSADTYYWRGSNTAWSDWTNIADGGWSLARDSHVAPSHVPGTDASDLMYAFGKTTSDTYIGHFNLGGASYTLAGFASLNDEKTWTVYRLGLTNGTLTVNNAKRMRENTARQIWLWNGATLNYNTAGLGAAA